MDLKWFTYAAALLMVAAILLFILIIVRQWKNGHKGASVISIIVLAALCIGFYGLFWKTLFG